MTAIDVQSRPWRAYRAYGLGIRSRIALPELTPDAMGQIDVTIHLEPGRSGEIRESALYLDRDEMRLDLPNARYRVRQGREIIVEPVGEVPERDLRAHLLGSVMGAIFHQRGLTPLHAGAIEVDGAAVALAGPSGAGKSTLVACLEDMGRRALCDDICVVDFDAAGAPRTWPGSRGIKLWRDAILALGRETGGAEPVYGDLDKFSLPMAGAAQGESPIPLARIYVLRRSTGDDGIRRLRGAEAVDAILSNVYRWDWAIGMGRARASFEACAALARRGEIFVVDRSWGFDGLRSQAEAIERHMARLG